MDDSNGQDNVEDVLEEVMVEGVRIDGEDDFVDIDFSTITEDDVLNFHFPDMDVAFAFYNKFAMLKGFYARKAKERKNKNNEIVEKSFFCHKEGKRRRRKGVKGVRAQKPETRCFCKASMKIRVNKQTGRWHVTYFSDDHTHKLLDPKYSRMLPTHRRMNDADIMQMNNMRKAGISAPQIYSSFACQAGGFEHVGFSKRDMYNQIVKQRQFHPSDAKTAIKFLRGLKAADEEMFWSHTVDDEGKSPAAVITDGDVAMGNSIRRVFPNMTHRLCAWHLLRNAASNVKNLKMVLEFRKCMLGDYELHQFHRRWDKMVKAFSLEDNTWVKDTYEKRKMWATTYLRGNFFAGFRTTSRCEGLHSHLGKFVHSRNDLADFLENFRRCLESFHYRELEADFTSVHGEPVMQTNIQSLERSACKVFIREVFIVLVHLNIEEMPQCLVLERWTMAIKENIRSFNGDHSTLLDSVYMARCGALDWLCKLMTRSCARSTYKFNVTRELVTKHLQWLDETNEANVENNSKVDDSDIFRDPVRVGSKGCVVASSSRPTKSRKRQRCRVCGEAGHNRTTCSMNRNASYATRKESCDVFEMTGINEEGPGERRSETNDDIPRSGEV
ncbi:MULE transposase domain [Sesbania bispinosa]|nr:MULE transposase domain [Sesbania bispinosa]